MKKLLLTLFLCALAVPARAQIVVPNTLVAGATILVAGLNANFTAIGGDALNRTGGTMTGSLTTQNIFAGVTASYDIGSNGTRFKAAYFSGAVTSATVVASGLITAGSLTTTGTLTAVDITASGAVVGVSYTGPRFYAVVAKATDYTLLTTNEVVLGSGVTTLTLYTCTGNTGRWVDIKKTDSANTLTIDGNAAETIDGALTLALTLQYQSYTLLCDGTSWHIL